MNKYHGYFHALNIKLPNCPHNIKALPQFRKSICLKITRTWKDTFFVIELGSVYKNVELMCYCIHFVNILTITVFIWKVRCVIFNHNELKIDIIKAFLALFTGIMLISTLWMFCLLFYSLSRLLLSYLFTFIIILTLMSQTVMYFLTIQSNNPNQILQCENVAFSHFVHGKDRAIITKRCLTWHFDINIAKTYR